MAYAGDNFLRYSGEAKKISELQSFAFNAAEQGSDINIIVSIHEIVNALKLMLEKV